MNFTRLIKINIILVFFLTIACGSNNDLATNEIEENAIISITSGNSIDFGDVIIGVEVIKSFEIKNIGNIDLVIKNITIPSYFSTDINSATISPEETLTLKITFKPTEIIEANEELIITSNATSGENTIAILGNGINNIFEGWKQLSSQEQVNSFGALNYNEITGFLTIASLSTGGASSNITDLRPLKSLTSIGGKLALFFNDNLTSLEGLDNLTSVDGGIQVQLQNLESFDGLGKLSTVDDDFEIVLNNRLTSLNGLNNLTYVGGDLIIRINSSLTSLAGLNNLSTVGGNLFIEDNPSITSIEDLENLTKIGGGLGIHENDVLTSIEGVSKIDSLKWRLQISRNPLLESLDPLGNLTYLDGEVRMFKNGFSSLQGLDKLSVVTGRLDISNNDFLTDFCSIRELIVGGAVSEDNYVVKSNAYNPTFEQVQLSESGGCEQ